MADPRLTVESKLVDLMAALEASVSDAKQAHDALRVAKRVLTALDARGHEITISQAETIVKAHLASNGGPTSVSAAMRSIHPDSGNRPCWYADLHAVFDAIEFASRSGEQPPPLTTRGDSAEVGAP